MTFYAASSTDPWWHASRVTAELSCSEPVIAIECEEAEEGYFAYRDASGAYPVGALVSFDLLAMCFPYGIAAQIQHHEGAVVRVRRKE